MLAGYVPPGIGRSIAQGIGVLTGRVGGPPAARRALVARHLSRVYGRTLQGREREQLVDEAFASYARYYWEILRLPNLSAAEIDAGMSFEGFGFLEEALGEGGGAIVALPHLGGWEWAGMYMIRTGRPVSVVVESLMYEEVFDWFVAYRRSLGMEVIPTGPEAAHAALRALRENRVLALLCDRVVDATPGTVVTFFGEGTAMPSGPVTLALRTGAPVFPCGVYFGPGPSDHLTVMRPRLELHRKGRFRDDVQAGTQLLAHEFEALIRRAPTQWHLMQPHWPSDPR